MTHHLPTSQLKRFSVSALQKEELAAVVSHVADCHSCHQRFIEELQHQRNSIASSFTLASEFWFRNDHLDFQHLVSIADENLDTTVREILEIHLTTCQTCHEDVESFLAFRKDNDRQTDISYGPIHKATTREAIPKVLWWPRLASKPAYTVAAVIIVFVTLLVGALFLKRRSDNLQANADRQSPIAQTSPTATLPIPPTEGPSPEPSPEPTTNDSSDTVAVLKDGQGEVAIHKNGDVTGLDDVSSASRQEIAQASLKEQFESPEILKRLAGDESGLRGANSRGKTFRLFYPAQRVVIEDRPTFKWANLDGANSYRVYVLDSNGNEVGKSKELSPTQTQWRVPLSLKRGEIFSWVVTASINGTEIVSPPASAPEMKFAVLSQRDIQELTILKKANSHLALGVFYAKTGLIVEAEREFQKLAHLNPQTQLPKTLLQSVRNLTKSKQR